MVGVPCRQGRRRGRRLSDIFAAQATDPALLAELYDLEHEESDSDLVFYREFARRASGAILDLGTGSGRLLPTLVAVARGRVVGVDGSQALLARARARVAAAPDLRAAADARRLELLAGDIRDPAVQGRFALILAVGVLPHLSGPADAERMLLAAARRLTSAGRLIVDLPGPAALPDRDLPLGDDWERDHGGTAVRRASRLTHRRTDDGVSVLLSTITELARPDGTIARLPAAFRLWYPDVGLLERLFARAELGVSAIYGSHELDAFDDDSERLIVIGERLGRHGSAYGDRLG